MWFVLLAMAGCAHRGGFPGPPKAVGSAPERPVFFTEDDGNPTDPEPIPWGEVGVAEAAASFVGKNKLVVRGQRYRWDCSGYICAVYEKAGFTLSGSSRSLHDLAKSERVYHKKKMPHPGDIAFFDNTYDRNKNGRRDDTLSHVAVVETVDRDGTIMLIHKGSQGVTRLRMNLKQPGTHADSNGKVLNDFLRASKDKDGGPTLAGELLRGFGSLWKVDGDALAEG